ncbi:hypothetical protein [Halorubrum tibetense]|uniref:DUF420 domain-containing protein n=1 Tax=Halorubrum tibetense TaxID=175631 RepID=A0ABD5S8M8_9EURY
MTGSGTRTRWVYAIAAVPVTFALLAVAGTAVAATVLSGTTAFGTAALDDPVVGTAVALAIVPNLVAVVVLPYAVYRDLGSVRDVTGDWSPDRSLHTLIAVVGLFVPFVIPGYATYYLVKRRRHVGV